MEEEKRTGGEEEYVAHDHYAWDDPRRGSMRAGEVAQDHGTDALDEDKKSILFPVVITSVN